MSGPLNPGWLVSIALLLLSCQAPGVTGAGSSSPPGAATVATTPAAAAAAAVPDLTGCWQASEKQGGSKVTIVRVSPTAFGFSSTPETRLEMSGHTFKELTRDDSKPYYPVGQVQSSGVLSEDGQSITRIVAGSTEPQLLTRCTTP